MKDRVRLGVLVLIGAAAAAAYPWRPSPVLATGLRVAAAALVLLLVWHLARRDGPAPRLGARWIAALSVVACAALALGAFGAFPLSADEFGYLYAADTLAAGRLWNAPLPDWAQDVAKTLYIADGPGLRVAQYTPGWPAVLALAGGAGVPAWLVAPLLGGVSAWLLLQIARDLGLDAPARVAVAVLVLLAPFWLFTHATHFNHALAMAAALAVVALDGRDRRNPSPWTMAAIGFAFSLLLATRPDTFAILFGLYVLGGLARHGLRFLPRALPAAAAALPVVAAAGAYNAAITGHPLATPMQWTLPDLGLGLWATGVDGPHSPARALAHTLRWLTGWIDFAAVAVLALLPFALARGWRAGTLRWWDFTLPACAAFFLFYPDYGGIQHGPRYWFLAHPFVVLTVARLLTGPDGWWRVAGIRLRPAGIAAGQAAVFLGFAMVYAAFIRAQAEARSQPLQVAATAPTPAVVLFPDLEQRYVPWQRRPQLLDAEDLTRNGIDGVGPVLLASLPQDMDRLRRLCEQAGRPVLRYREEGAPPRGALAPACP